ncbi:hypothetical protein A33Q_3341 [Indibacter alkaliphilus LW1]|uniref:Uncharacterized protein n=1 Tax=Indibacter alkaliphilus (strain CCUG 57479 / KCTC 22604 / LW1) TaxID=1189612 RepID=S2DSV4_INDAL|nr:hypothetical protein A33Q_3341 [Indibacter alkaliphilus LW1]
MREVLFLRDAPSSFFSFKISNILLYKNRKSEVFDFKKGKKGFADSLQSLKYQV